MSVLIKGMDMPTSEEKCKFFQPAPFRAPFCVINGVCHGIDDCPLKPIPPHGRLVDADALKKKWLEAENRMGADKVIELPLKEYITNGCVYDLEDAPTIIPAEEGE